MRRLVVICLLCMSGCSGAAWTGFFYPDIEDIPNADQVQNFTIGNYET